MQGIYQIRNIENNKIYIGSSVDIEQRFRTHRNNLDKNKHGNYKLQGDWNSYGDENFKFEVLETNNMATRDEISALEQKYIDVLKPHENGYNILHKVTGVSLKHKKIQSEEREDYSPELQEDFTTKVAIRRVGNSKGVLIPSRILNAMNMSEGDEVFISFKDGKLIIENEYRIETFDDKVITVLEKYFKANNLKI